MPKKEDERVEAMDEVNCSWGVRVCVSRAKGNNSNNNTSNGNRNEDDNHQWESL